MGCILTLNAKKFVIPLGFLNLVHTPYLGAFKTGYVIINLKNTRR